MGELHVKTGLAGFDGTVGDLRPGAFYCVAGRPCTGKTQLLLDLALRIHLRYETNVVFATAQEFPEQIIARASEADRLCLVELPALGVLRTEVGARPGHEPYVYLVDVRDVGPTWPHYMAHSLNAGHVARCGLMVSNGWTVYEGRDRYLKRVVGGVPYRLRCDRPATLLSSSTLARAKRFAHGSGVATIYGICSAWHDEQETGPRSEDLLELRSAVEKTAERTILLHRPELYEPFEPGQANASVLELAVGARRAELRFDEEKRTFGPALRSVRCG